jgi:hypothetical protein
VDRRGGSIGHTTDRPGVTEDGTTAEQAIDRIEAAGHPRPRHRRLRARVHLPTPIAANDVMDLGAALCSTSRLGSTEPDFTEARIDQPVVGVEIDVKGGSVEIRLPEGASASVDGVRVTAGSTEDHREHREPTGCQHVTIGGTLSWGSLEIRGPRRNSVRWR